MNPAPASPRPSTRGLGMRMFKGIAWATSAKFLGMGAALAVNALLARMLSTEAMGSYFLFVSVVSFAALLARMGIQQTVVRLVAESVADGLPGRARKALGYVYRIVAVGSVVVGCAVYFGGGHWVSVTLFHDPRMAALSGLMALWIVIFAFTTPVAETFRGLHDFRTTTYLQLVLPPVLLAIPLGLLRFLHAPVDLELAVRLSVGAALVSLALGTAMLARRMRRVRGEGGIRFGEVLRISGPIFVMNMANFALANFSLWVAGMMLAASDVALFGAAIKLMYLVAIPLGLVGAVVQPFIAQLYGSGEKARLQRLLRGGATLAGLPAVCVLLVFVLFGKFVLGTMYGAPYAAASLCLVILALGELVNVWTGSCGHLLVITGHQRQAMQQALVWGAITAVGSFVGAYLGGMVGLAIAVSVGISMTNLTKLWLARKYTGLSSHAVLDPRAIRDAVRSIREQRARDKKAGTGAAS